jgi:hypothetical protein
VQNHFTFYRSIELHGENSVLVLDGGELGGGIDQAIAIAEGIAVLAKRPFRERDVDRQPQRIARGYVNGGQGDGPLQRRIEDA